MKKKNLFKSLFLSTILITTIFTMLFSGCKDKEEKIEETITEISSVEMLKNVLKSGGKCILMQDISSDEGFVVSEDVTVDLNLNRKSIICFNEGESLVNKGTLNMYNGRVYSLNAEGQGRMAIKNEGKFTGERLILGSKNSRGNAIRNYGTAKLSNSIVDCCDNFLNGSGYAYPITNSNGEMTIENCRYNGSANGVFGCDNGSIIVNGGEYVLMGEKPFYMFYLDEGKITINSGIFVKNNALTRPLAYSEQGNFDNLIINGGKIIYNGSPWTK